jgi:curved DNA-binding protein CbpA
MAVNRDLYLILNVAPIATEDEIRKAYRSLTKKYHPDLNPSMKQYSDDKMKELVEAYNVLSNKDKRKEYEKQPWFQVKKFRGGKKKSVQAIGADFARKPVYEKEASLLDRILSPFLKKKDSAEGGGKIDYKQSDVHFTMGLTMSENPAFFPDAKKEFKESMRFDPGASDAQYNYALMCYKLGEYEEARIHFQKFLAMVKDDPHGKRMITLLTEEY